MKKKRIFLLIVLILFLLAFTDAMVSLHGLRLERYEIKDSSLPASFEGFKIAQVSDLHNAEFGEGNSKLIKKIADENPDIIALTGDIVDENTKDFDAVALLIKKLSEIAPCFYVTGNHEAWIYKDYIPFEEKITDYVTVLHNSSVKSEREGEKIIIQGLDDPNYLYSFNESVKRLSQEEGYKILLSHRPEKFEDYVEGNFNLVLSGHTHGGQVRLPFIGAVVAPTQRFFPKYVSGLYSENNTNMIVSDGLGTSVVPLRLNNPPEIVIVELTR